MAGELGYIDIKALIDAYIKVNGNREITPPLHNIIETALANSNLNKVDGGVLQALAFYSSALAISDPLTLVYKSYVDDLITALEALTQGTNILTEDLFFFADGNTLTIRSGEDIDAIPYAEIILNESGTTLNFATAGGVINSVNVEENTASISHTDNGDSSNNSFVICADKKVQLTGSLQINPAIEMQEYPIYWRGNADSPVEGDIREYYSEATDEIITEKYTSGAWTFRGSR